MEYKYKNISGKKIIPMPGETIVPDHFIQSFTVTIRSLSPLHPDSIKDQLQKKWEVTECTKTDDTIVIK